MANKESFLSIFPGPPKDFCVDKTDGGYANPTNNRQFFYCQNHLASQCLWCEPMLIFNQECCRCLYLNQGKPCLLMNMEI